MPSYDFKCSKCESVETVVFGIKEELIAPKCCKAAMTRQYGLQAVQFKGSGWASKEK